MTFVKGLKRAETAQETIERLTMPVPPSECWMWLGYHHFGYAMMMHGRGRERKQTHVTRFLMNAPKGMDVDHLCHNPWCVNPYHLEVVTHLENIRRHAAWKKANRQVCEKHGELLRIYGRIRICRSCRNEYQGHYRGPRAPHKGQRKFTCDDCGGPYVRIGNVTGRSGRYGCLNCGRGWPYRKIPAKYGRTTTDGTEP